MQREGVQAGRDVDSEAELRIAVHLASNEVHQGFLLRFRQGSMQVTGYATKDQGCVRMDDTELFCGFPHRMTC